MYKAVFTDMDGTLLTEQHTVSHITQKKIAQLIDAGILVIPISARPLHGMQHITDHVFPKNIPIVSLNGSYIWHKGSIIYEAAVPLAEAAAVNSLAAKHPVSAMYYSQMEWYANDHTDAVKKEQKITRIPITVQPFEKTFETWTEKQSGPNKILIAGDPALIFAIEQEMLQLFGEKVNIFKSQPKYVEVMNRSASKTSAMQFIMNIYGLKQEEVIAIGDNYNDKGMIEFAGLGIAMGNAPDEIKDAADMVTDTNNRDGVATILDKIFS
jgi:Cof subfamily protein (haloacid dehalogenase superfamily)